MGTSKGERTPLGNPVAFDGGLVEIGARTWAWIQPNGGLGESNAGLVVGDGEALLVDTLWDENLTAAMLSAMEPVTAAAGAPIGQLFNTHGDGDHWYGNGLLPPRHRSPPPSRRSRRCGRSRRRCSPEWHPWRARPACSAACR